jgi:hypothetical protein
MTKTTYQQFLRANFLRAMDEGRVVKLPEDGGSRVFPTVQAAWDFVAECQEKGIAASRIKPLVHA